MANRRVLGEENLICIVTFAEEEFSIREIPQRLQLSQSLDFRTIVRYLETPKDTRGLS